VLRLGRSEGRSIRTPHRAQPALRLEPRPC
jgi:hypothetical protein